MARQKLKLSRESLALFLKNHEQIKQFERLFAAGDEVVKTDLEGIQVAAENALALAASQAAMIERLSSRLGLLQEAENKASEAISRAERIAASLQILLNAPLPQSHNSLVTDYIDLPENGPHVTTARRIQWNPDDGTLDVGLYNDVVLQCGQEHHYYAKNTSGSQINNGKAASFTGAVGASGKLTFGLAVSDGSQPGEYLMGVTTQDVANNAFGYVTSFGLVRGLDTSGTPYGEAWADGDLLYIDPASPGDWTKTAPTAPNFHIPVAVVIYATAGNAGSIFVRFKTGESLGTLHDVLISSPGVNHVLQYDNANSRWTNTQTPSFGGASDYTQFESDGTMRAYGAATCFRDEKNDLIKTGKNNPAARLQDDLTEGALVFTTAATTADWAIMNVQINHDWKIGSTVYPHLHWWQTESNMPNWLIQYRWQVNGAAKTTAWASLAWASNAFTWTAGALDQITGFGGITPPVGAGLSDILQLRYIRDSANASGLFAGADPFTTDASATSSDTHIEIDMLGSRQQYVK